MTKRILATLTFTLPLLFGAGCVTEGYEDHEDWEDVDSTQIELLSVEPINADTEKRCEEEKGDCHYICQQEDVDGKVFGWTVRGDCNADCSCPAAAKGCILRHNMCGDGV